MTTGIFILLFILCSVQFRHHLLLVSTRLPHFLWISEWTVPISTSNLRLIRFKNVGEKNCNRSIGVPECLGSLNLLNLPLLTQPHDRLCLTSPPNHVTPLHLTTSMNHMKEKFKFDFMDLLYWCEKWKWKVEVNHSCSSRQISGPDLTWHV
jgi:hypothetical protein